MIKYAFSGAEGIKYKTFTIEEIEKGESLIYTEIMKNKGYTLLYKMIVEEGE